MSTDYVSLLKSLGLQPQQQSHREHFLVQNNDGYTVLNVQDINHISTENGITRALLHNGRSMVLNYLLNDIEAQLNPSKFFRANVRAAQRMDRQVIKLKTTKAKAA